METIVFRIAQEALTNVTKHARATTVNVTLSFAEDEIYLRVQDDGLGFQVEEMFENGSQRRHWGLLGMQERVALVGGSCEIDSTPGQGTAVQVCIPLQSEQ